MTLKSLRAEALVGVQSAGTSLAATSILQLLGVAVLARLLAPSEFGLMGMVLVVTGFASIFQDMGVGHATIYRQDVTREQLSSLYWANILFGLLVFCAFWAATPVVVAWYREPRVGELMLWLRWLFVIVPIGQQGQMLLEKHLEFRRLAGIEIAATGLGVAVAVGLAVRAYGVFALAGGILAAAAAKALLLALTGWTRWRPSPRFRLSDLTPHLDYGVYHVGQRAVNYVTGNADFLLIGSFLGAQALGYYALAYQAVNVPSSMVNAMVSRVCFPVFARVQQDLEKLTRGYLLMQESTSLANVPLAFGIAVLAPLGVPWLLGEAWSPAIPLVQILAFVGLGRAIAGTVGPLILARGRTDLGFRWSLLILLLQVPGIYLGVRSGSPVGVAIAFAILTAIYLPLNYRLLIRTLLGPCLWEYLRAMWPSFWMSGVMTLSMILTVNLAVWAIPPLGWQLVTGLVVYGFLLWLTRRARLVEVIRLGRRVTA